MKTRHARNIRHGLWVARWREAHPDLKNSEFAPSAGGGLSERAYRRAQLRFHPELGIPDVLPMIPGKEKTDE